MTMRLTTVIYLILGTCLLVTGFNPLKQAYEDYQSLHFERGCDVTVLPDMIDWCNGSVNADGRMADGTVCMSVSWKHRYLLCSYGRWNNRTEESLKGRSRRSIAPAVATVTGETCSMFCVDDNQDAGTMNPPTFSRCPASVVLYTEGNATSVTHEWDEPIPVDSDGNITSFKKIIGPNSTATFEAAPTPGVRHVISYLATDDNQLTTPCWFSITAEIPDCPPILHIKNGNLSCWHNDTVIGHNNTRGSNCSIECYPGYRLNGSSTTVCRDNGTWSDDVDAAQCNPLRCEGEPVNITDMVYSCDENQGDYNSVCWLHCQKNFILRNDMHENATLTTLDDTLDDATAAYSIARQEALEARDDADDAEANVSTINDTLHTAQDFTDELNTQLEDEEQTMNVLTSLLELKKLERNLTQLQIEHALLTNSPVDDLHNNLQNTLEEIENTLDDIAVQEFVIGNLTKTIENQQVKIDSLQNNFNTALNNASKLETEAQEKDSNAADALNALQVATHNFNEATMRAGQSGATILTHAICGPDGEWIITGNPICVDIEPPDLKCLPILTVYVSGDETSSQVTWELPTVQDNSGNVTVYKVSGPDPGDVLGLGQHLVVYKATDGHDNDSPPCTLIINIEVRSCGSLADHLQDDHLTYSCPNYHEGTTCELMCPNHYTLIGVNNASCVLDTSSPVHTVSWHVGEASCEEEEECPFLPEPLNGQVVCIDGITVNGTNSTVDGNPSNATTTDLDSTSSSCTVLCDNGYVLPYTINYTYTCDRDGDGIWHPENFPAACIDAGAAMFSEYNLVLQYQTTESCADEDLGGFQTDWQAIITAEMDSYPTCSHGYTCSYGTSGAACTQGNDISNVSIEFNIIVTCEDVSNSGNNCDLGTDLMSSLADAIRGSVQQRGVLDSHNIELPEDWLTEETSNIPSCATGKVLIGKYCVGCPAGYFYAPKQATCVTCPYGSYGDTHGRFYCITCPVGTTTLSTGVTSSQHCKAECAPGTFSNTTLEPCVKCEPGSYQSDSAATTCVPCPPNTWTTIEGSDSADKCVDFDIYFDADEASVTLTTVSTAVSMVFWLKSNALPRLTAGLYYDETEFAFQIDTTENMQLMFGWDNTPTDIMIESGVWMLIGLTWASHNSSISLYKNGELGYQTLLDADPLNRVADTLKISVNQGTTLAGLSVTQTLVGAGGMKAAFEDCDNSLAGEMFSMLDLANLSLTTAKYINTTCGASSSVTVDSCLIHGCLNGGTCLQNGTTGYRCNCTEMFAGPFCDHEIVNGGWSDWFQESACSVTCGPGTYLMYRLCNNPYKSEYGEDCEGNSTQTIDCNPANCTVCEPLVGEGGTTCDLEMDACIAACPPGYVLTPGQHRQTFHCGEPTGYQWLPMSRLPICTVGQQPLSYTARVTFTFISPVSCSVVDNVTQAFRVIVSQLRCVDDNSACSVTVAIEGCTGNRRRRQAVTSILVIEFSVPLTQGLVFDLPTYYATLDMTDSINETIRAISAIELTIRDLLDNPGQLTTILDGVTYTVYVDDVVVTTDTQCSGGLVAISGLCTECQKGTYLVGDVCMYCKIGTYQWKPGQDSCISCPGSMTTLHIGARNISECIDLHKLESSGKTDTQSWLIIIIICCVGLIIILVSLCLARRLYSGAKDREKFDMEADQVSLYTDFPDIAYNVYFKQRKVVGFDEEGLPIISQEPVKNGHVMKDGADGEPPENKDARRESSPDVTSAPFAYPPTDYKDPPFTYDPYSLWSEDLIGSVPPDSSFDFPKLQKACRFRVPGRKHMQNSYPLSQFGYEGDVRGRSRRLLPLPVAMPIPKKLPHLMYRPPCKVSVYQRLREMWGVKHRTDSSDDEEIDIPFVHSPETIDESPSPLPPRKPYAGIKFGPSTKLSKRSPSASSSKVIRAVPPGKRSPSAAMKSKRAVSAVGLRISQRSGSAASTKLSPRPKSAIVNKPVSRPQSAHRSKFSPKFVPSIPSLLSPPVPFLNNMLSPRSTASVSISPRSIPSEEKSPRSPMVEEKPRSPLSEEKSPRTPRTEEELYEQMSHPKPSRIHVPRQHIQFPPSLPPQITTRPKSSMRDPDARPSTSKSVRIVEDESVARHDDTSRSTRPSSTALSTRSTHVTPLRPRSAYHDTPLPNEVAEVYRPHSSGHRPITPSFHMKPYIHGNVTVHRTEDFVMFQPPPNLAFGAPPPSDHKMKLMKPPPFLNKTNKIRPRPKTPDGRSSRGSSRLNVWSSRQSVRETAEVDKEDGQSTQGSVFLTEVPEIRPGSSTSVNNGSSHTQNEHSPPPTYDEATHDRIIEESAVDSD